MDEEKPNEQKCYDFSLKMANKPAQGIEPKLASLNRIYTQTFNVKGKTIDSGNQFVALFMQSNPPFRKSLDYNGIKVVAVCENERTYFFDKKEFVSTTKPQIQESSKRDQLNQIYKSFGQEYAMAPIPFDKNKSLSRFEASHSILSIQFNKCAPNVVALVGTDQITIVNINKEGKVTNSRILTFTGDSDFILRAKWLPGHKSALMLASLKGIRIYDTAADLDTPLVIYTTLETYLRDAEIYLTKEDGTEYRVVATSADGQLYT